MNKELTPLEALTIDNSRMIDLGKTASKFNTLYISDENMPIMFNNKEYTMKEIEKQDEVLQIIKTIPFELKYDEDTDDWHLYIIITTQDEEYRETVAFGEGKEKFDLLKEELL